jgi:hypothetical protein
MEERGLELDCLPIFTSLTIFEVSMMFDIR